MSVYTMDRHDEAVELRKKGLSYLEIGAQLGMSRQSAYALITGPRTKDPLAFPPSPWMTISEAARLIHVHHNTLRRWADRGLVPTFRVGNRGDRRFRRTDIEALLQSGELHKLMLTRAAKPKIGRASCRERV